MLDKDRGIINFSFIWSLFTVVTLSSNAVQWPGVAVIFYRTENSNPAVGHPPNTDVLCVQQTEIALTPNIANLIHPLRLSRLSVHPG